MFNRRQFGKTLFMTAGTAMLATTKRAVADAAAAPQIVTLIKEAESGTPIFRQGQEAEKDARRFSPCSTFKVAIALMGFDAGILLDEHHPLLAYRPEYKAQADRDKKAVDPTIWLRDSIVWYSQQTTRQLGMERFQAYVNKFNYGNRDLSGDPGKHDGLTHAWLMSSLQISVDEQVDFIRRLLASDLGVSPHAYLMTIASLPVFPVADGWTVRGKTGTGTFATSAQASLKGQQQGWFVGWAEKGKRRLAFARWEIGNATADTPAGPQARASFLADFGKMVGGQG
ncbi:MAG TPA: class D beta-lactamase [Dongiaceae bacterium]|nr:class D beta-lactamase [Dongiaceae bacterium]